MEKAGGDLAELIHSTAEADYQFNWISQYQIHVGCGKRANGK